MWAQRFLESSLSLPGGLLFDNALSECRRFETIAIQPMTGHEEDWLATSRGVPSAIVATHLIDACVTQLDGQAPPDNLARRLLSGDRDFLILQIRRLALGDDVRAVANCPQCAKSMDVGFNANEILVEGQPEDTASYSIELEARDNIAARRIQFRLPVGADQEAVARMEIDEAAACLFARCLLKDGGHPLTAEEEERVCEAMERAAPAINLELDLICPECEHAFLLPFDTTAFFLEEMRISGRQLLNEVHSLAFYYHWTETEILGLVRDRRRRYLALLRETVGEA
jgi:hypothetical protein